MIIERTNYTWTASAVLGVYRVFSPLLAEEELNVTYEKCLSGRYGLVFRLFRDCSLIALDKFYIPFSCCAESAIDVVLKTIFGIKEYELKNYSPNGYTECRAGSKDS